MPYGRTTDEQDSYRCSGSDVGEDSHCDYRSHHQDEVRASGFWCDASEPTPNALSTPNLLDSALSLIVHQLLHEHPDG